MLKILGVILIFIALAIVSMAGLSSLGSIDAEINQSALSEPMAGAYNFSQSSTETGYTMFSGAIIFAGIAIFVAAIAVMVAALRLR
jgi:phosphotransferase system  glucose/maltose/N-acetylglucosamine-specific IIC component